MTGIMSSFDNRSLARRISKYLLAAILCFLLSVTAGGGLSADYRLSTGDILTFDFLDDAELPVTVTISSDGDAQFPLIGSVKIDGLTVTAALEKLRSEYRSREILIDPKLSLNISTFRPIFILGEVRTPGSFPFYSGLTVEQAVGLAGGTQIASVNPSDRIVARARLRGEIEGADAQIVYEAIYAARLVAQLNNSAKIDLKDVPEVAKEFLTDLPLKGVIEVEEKILSADLAANKSQTAILSEGITQGQGAIDILDQLVVQQKEVVDINEKDLARVSSLRKRELNTESDLSRAKNNASNEKSQLLETFATLARSRRELSEMKLQFAKLGADREKEILMQLQERDVEIKKLIASRHAAQEQILLMAAASADEANKSKISYTYEIRRNPVGGKPASIEASPLTEMLPGDVLVVAITGM
ncbi:polysaccharide biosynthesis/export family protein [Ensifer sp. ENS11]|uniref:polysaccharide biosynthesis/export family protein n=1 Tax=Ensifer sp. ENS11 TaxID=2769291 RepID=UPI0017856729|nr:polysaccharide biosynthesis/export family protein [Ensifer sp. ENS11]MBD9490060.1 polysaccharide biosynthesis/export family protein [Ensifer sp. ENS11]